MRLALVFDKVREDTVGIYFERACRQLGIPFDHFWTKQARAIPPNYELYLRIDHGDYHDDLPSQLRPKVFYAVDTHLAKSWSRIRHLAKRYDRTCCAQRQAAASLHNGVWVPLACDPGCHGRVGTGTRWDIAFVGTEGGVPRKFFLQAIQERFPNSFLGHAPHTELGKIYSQARIGFNYSIRHDVNMRMFEILCAGTFLLTNDLRHDDLKQLGLVDGVHYVSYHSPQELFQLIDYFLSHDAERVAIALRGMAAVQEHHTYRHRLGQILRVVDERLMLAPLARGASQEVSSCACS